MSLLETTLNTRCILPDSLSYIRSDVPNNLTDKEIDWLISNNICTIIDLREDEECQLKKCRLIDDNRFCYHCMPVTGGNKIPGSVDEVSKSYINMADDYIVEDYMKTKENLADAFENFARQCPEVDINVITPNERYMREFLQWLKKGLQGCNRDYGDQFREERASATL